jgi:hypothetical protein
MKLKQWDTADWVLPAGKSEPKAANHPCVIISSDAVCANPDIPDVNVLAASTHRTHRPPRANEFLLDAADGMDWETLVRLHLIWVAPKKELRLRKTVSEPRRRALAAQMIRFNGWLG